MFFNGPDKDSNIHEDESFLETESERSQGEVIVSHLVEYLLATGESIGDITWPEPGPSDLTRARSVALGARRAFSKHQPSR